MDSLSTTMAVDVQEARIVNVLQEEIVVNKAAEEDSIKEKLLRSVDIEVYDYIVRHVIPERSGVKVMDTNVIDDLKPLDFNGITSLVNFRKVNNLRYVNQFLIRINKCLPDAGMFIGCVETVAERKKHLFKNRKNIFLSIYWFYCFVFHRICPKIKFIQKIYFAVTRGKYRWLTQAEVLGRLVSCGFDIIEFKSIQGKLYFAVMKTSDPDNNPNPSFGPLFPMKRVGKGGKMIKVYKLRTMHPYSEYLQKFVIQLNGYNEVGKPANDFRLADWGKFYRKYWLDELPQLINLLKGEVGLVGVRPLSKTRFDELPEDVRKQRIKFKPGCIPPYVALNMPDSDGNIEAERIYMEERLKNGFRTDIKYFFLALYNIFTGKIKSS